MRGGQPSPRAPSIAGADRGHRFIGGTGGAYTHPRQVLMNRPRAKARPGAALLLILAALVALPAIARAQDIDLDVTDTDLPVKITADQIHYDSEDLVYTAEGRVRIVQKDRALTANWVLLDSESRIGVASGNVVLRDESEVIHADFMEFNIDSLAGIVYRGRFENQETNFRITGGEIRRLSDKEYRLKQGTFTTCDCGPGQVPSWRIEGDQVDVTVDGYAKVRGAKFEVKDKTLAYIPYGLFPVKTTRQSGLLFPSIGSSNRNGFEFNLPYYWAVSENTDATFYQEILGKRGLKEGVEYRYVFTPETYGQANVWYLNDQDVNSGDPFDANRWGIRWDHRQGLPQGIVGKADVNLVSDNRYPIDFQDIGRDSNRFLESKGQLERPFDRGNVIAGVIYGDDLQSPDDLDRDSFVLNRFPYVQANVVEMPVFDSPVNFELNSSFVNFYQRDDPRDEARRKFGSIAGLDTTAFLDTGIDALYSREERNSTATNNLYHEFKPDLPGGTNPALENPDPSQDDFRREVVEPPPDPITPFVDLERDVILNPNGTEGDFVFQEGEILANAGQRIDIYPRISMPMQAGKYLDIRPEVGVRETMWRSSDFADSSTHRDLFTGRVDVSTQLEKTWGSPLDRWESIYQTTEPQLSFLTIQGSDDEILDDDPDIHNFSEFQRFEGTHHFFKVDHPVFVPPGSTNQARQRFFALDNVLLDQSDVIPDQTVVYYTVENQFFVRDGGEGGTSRRLVRLRTGTGFDIENDIDLDSIMEVKVEPTEQFEVFADATYNNDIERLDKFNIGGILSTNRGDRVAMRYRMSKSFAQTFENFSGDPDFENFDAGFDEISELNTSLRLRLLSNVDFLYGSNYSFNVQEFFRQVYSVVYRSKCNCWSTNLSIVDRARANDTQFRVLVNLEGLGAIGNTGGGP